ncbi:MAG: O-antigen ligase family protein [Candidatus Peribacteria bacterium]|nr:O-antigen ligase family protein [Candidatus Peribacteria bacterium]
MIAFFPVIALGYLRKKSIKKQFLFAVGVGLLVLSTWSRASIAVFGVEVVALALLLHRKLLKKWLRLLITLGMLGIGGLAVFGQKFFAREHSNTGHLVLMVEGRKLAQERLITGRGAGYAGPASHQLCATKEKVDIFATEISHPDPRCETIRKVNLQHQISTYGYNPENQYLQIIMEYGLIGLLFW